MDTLIETYQGRTATYGLTDQPVQAGYDQHALVNADNAKELVRCHPEMWQIMKQESNSMNWGNWLKGLGVMVGAAAASAAAQVVSNRSTNKSAPAITGANVGLTAGVAAIGAFLAYLAQSPINPAPPPDVPK